MKFGHGLCLAVTSGTTAGTRLPRTNCQLYKQTVARNDIYEARRAAGLGFPFLAQDEARRVVFGEAEAAALTKRLALEEEVVVLERKVAATRLAFEEASEEVVTEREVAASPVPFQEPVVFVPPSRVQDDITVPLLESRPVSRLTSVCRAIEYAAAIISFFATILFTAVTLRNEIWSPEDGFLLVLKIAGAICAVTVVLVLCVCHLMRSD